MKEKILSVIKKYPYMVAYIFVAVVSQIIECIQYKGFFGDGFFILVGVHIVAMIINNILYKPSHIYLANIILMGLFYFNYLTQTYGEGKVFLGIVLSIILGVINILWTFSKKDKNERKHLVKMDKIEKQKIKEREEKFNEGKKYSNCVEIKRRYEEAKEQMSKLEYFDMKDKTLVGISEKEYKDACRYVKDNEYKYKFNSDIYAYDEVNNIVNKYEKGKMNELDLSKYLYKSESNSYERTRELKTIDSNIRKLEMKSQKMKELEKARNRMEEQRDKKMQELKKKIYETERAINEARKNQKFYKKDKQKSYYYTRRESDLKADLKAYKKELFLKEIGLKR